MYKLPTFIRDKKEILYCVYTTQQHLPSNRTYLMTVKDTRDMLDMMNKGTVIKYRNVNKLGMHVIMISMITRISLVAAWACIVRMQRFRPL